MGNVGCSLQHRVRELDGSVSSQTSSRRGTGDGMLLLAGAANLVCLSFDADDDDDTPPISVELNLLLPANPAFISTQTPFACTDIPSFGMKKPVTTQPASGSLFITHSAGSGSSAVPGSPIPDLNPGSFSLFFISVIRYCPWLVVIGARPPAKLGSKVRRWPRFSCAIQSSCRVTDAFSLDQPNQASPHNPFRKFALARSCTFVGATARHAIMYVCNGCSFVPVFPGES